MNRLQRMLEELADEYLDDQANAREFLACLDPLSVEGLWFEELARGFSSREKAALAYVREVRRVTST